jgi:hypothetical protein
MLYSCKILPHRKTNAFGKRKSILMAPGWTLVLMNLTQYNHSITKSRYEKFVSWKEPAIANHCQVVSYQDDFLTEMARNMTESNLALAQFKHPFSIHEEFSKIVAKGKDLQENVDKSLEWMEAQSDMCWNHHVHKYVHW